jgi:sugar lactone lactonase YvrE
MLRRGILTVLVMALACVPAAAARAAGACAPWHARTLLKGQGWLENLAFDGRGNLTISALNQSKLLKLKRGGTVKTLLSPVHAPGGQRLIGGRYLYFNTGDTLPLAPTGTVDRLDLRTGKHITWAKGLTMPNGLVFLPNGDAVVSRDLGTGTGLTRIRAKDPKHPQKNWAKIDDTNGMAVDPTGKYLYVDRTFTTDGEISRVTIAHPTQVKTVVKLGETTAPADLTVDRKGTLFVAGFTAGKVFRANPATGRSCAIATGLGQPTSARFGGKGWNAKHLYVTSATGTLTELTPPK